MKSSKTNSNGVNGHRFFLVLATMIMGLSLAQAQVPATPQRLFATVLNDTTVQLQWIDVATNELNYLIEAADVERGPWTQVAATTLNGNDSIYVLGGRTPGALSYYRVRARTLNLLYSGYSNIVPARQIAGRFQLEATVRLPNSVRGILAGDLRDDGKQRIVIGSQNTDSVFVYSYIAGGGYVLDKTLTTTSAQNFSFQMDRPCSCSVGMDRHMFWNSRKQSLRAPAARSSIWMMMARMNCS
jgi:hypothetical protein